ncbi:hypothetical protein EIK77_010179 [Talaromyces pinophilus]|nr:hypothetical protein EIK77_010179 [Talaromyces pinophilus]PCG91697.1 Hypothetical protein PENO1_092520 [Penicillium occitanis (nom. inval.)]PCG92224.1 hypothetical protein PENOC_093570 [Penicillium occitanis (nom. inval.)]
MTTQDNAEPAQPTTQAMPATELVTDPTAESATQPMAQAQSIKQPITQPITQPTAQPTAQPMAQSGDQSVAPVNQSNPTTRPSTPDAHDTSTPTAPTAVQIAHRDAQPVQPKNQEKQGRGRPPKSKASSNREQQQQQQQAPFSSVEAAIASAEAMMENAHIEAESYESLVSTMANNPPPDGGWETITWPQRQRTPPVAQEQTTTLTKKLTPINKVWKPVQGPL